MRFAVLLLACPALASAADCRYENVPQKAVETGGCQTYADAAPYRVLACDAGQDFRVMRGRQEILLRKTLGEGNFQSMRLFVSAVPACGRLLLASYGDEGGTWGTYLVTLDPVPKLLGEIENLDVVDQESDLLDHAAVSGAPGRPVVTFSGDLEFVDAQGKAVPVRSPKSYRFDGRRLVAGGR